MTDALQMETDIRQAEELLDRLSTRDVEKFGLRFISRLALETRRKMVQRTTIDHNQITGRLRSSIDIFVVSGGLEIGPTVFYARFVYEGWRYFAGTKTHEKTFRLILRRAPRIGLLTAREFLTDEVE